MKHLGFTLFIALLLVSCKKNQTPAYPDCFAQLQATHTSQTAFGGGEVVSLSDTTALIFYLNDATIGIGTAFENVSVSDLGSHSFIEFVEWKLHPDSIPPDLAGDVLYPNISSFQWWPLSSGDIRSAVSKVAADRDQSEWYNISIELTNAIFDRSQDGLPNVSIPNIVIKDGSQF